MMFVQTIELGQYESWTSGGDYSDFHSSSLSPLEVDWRGVVEWEEGGGWRSRGGAGSFPKPRPIAPTSDGIYSEKHHDSCLHKNWIAPFCSMMVLCFWQTKATHHPSL